MKDIAIVCDSSASIPDLLRSELNITIIPIIIHHEENSYRDLIDMKQEEFYKWLPSVKKLPTTATPGPGDFLKTYKKLQQDGYRTIISLHVSAKSSGTFRAAQIAGEMASAENPGTLVIPVDTENVAMCHGWITIEAARAVQRGANSEQVMKLIRRLVPLPRMIQTADTLKYLHMGGRIGNAAHLMGSLLNIKPLIGMENGVITPLGRERSRIKAYKRMVQMVKEAVGPGGEIKIAYLHAAAEDKVKELRDLIEKEVRPVETIIAELSPSLGVHSGPGTTGLCYFPAGVLQ